jgi:hypothetical protein
VPSLHPQQAIKLARAHFAYRDAKRALERAKAARAELLGQYKDRLPLKQWIAVAGNRFRYSRRSTGKRFSLADYLGAGHNVTKEMEPFISEGSYDHLDVEPVE